jgi:hypothetical protein
MACPMGTEKPVLTIDIIPQNDMVIGNRSYTLWMLILTPIGPDGVPLCRRKDPGQRAARRESAGGAEVFDPDKESF